MRVLHTPVNIAGQPYLFVQELRRRGIEAELLVFKERPFVRGYDHSLHLERHRSRIVKWALALRNFLRVSPQYDLFHYHAGMTLLFPFRWDLPILKSLGKKIVFQSWGSDMRGKSPKELNYLRYADAVIVGSYHMLDFAPEGSHVILPGLDLQQWPFSYSRQITNERARVLHAPSRRERKGTSFVIETVETLRHQGLPFSFVLVEDTPNAEALRIYRRCDIAVDQLLGGWYGIFALETMALGKAVIGYINPEQADRLEAARGVRPPIVSATPTTLSRELKRIISDREERFELGRRNRAYVERFHDIRSSAKVLEEIYKQVVG